MACQTPTRVSENDKNLESRVFSKIEYAKEVELKRSVIVDVRPQFEHQMSRPPRSFHALPSDWNLQGYSGKALQEKVGELQRILSLKGIDPFTQVVILGKGFSGRGEEFLLASTLLSLGIERITFINEKQAKKAFVARDLPQIENVPRWSRALKFNFNCGPNKKQKTAKKSKLADIVITGPENYFTQDLKVKKTEWPKSLRIRLYSPETFWSYGAALYLKEQGRQVCIL